MIHEIKEITFAEKEAAIKLAHTISNKMFLIYHPCGPVLGYLLLTDISTEICQQSNQMKYRIMQELCKEVSERFGKDTWVSEVIVA